MKSRYGAAGYALPIDKLIGKLYPIFGGVLIVMAVGIMAGLMIGGYYIPELRIANLHPDGKPVFPYMFITVACGADYCQRSADNSEQRYGNIINDARLPKIRGIPCSKRRKPLVFADMRTARGVYVGGIMHLYPYGGRGL